MLICFFIRLSTCLSVQLFVNLIVLLFMLSVHRFASYPLCVCLSVCLSSCLSVYLSVCLSPLGEGWGGLSARLPCHGVVVTFTLNPLSISYSSYFVFITCYSRCTKPQQEHNLLFTFGLLNEFTSYYNKI